MIERILFASDFSEITNRAEEYTIELARTTGARVTLIHSIEPVDGVTDDEYMNKLIDTRKRDARRKGEATAEKFRAADIDSELRIEVGKRWKTIVDAASEGEYDLVILGSHKIHDDDKVYLGTTTHKVFFSVDVPLLVVPYK